MSAFEVERVERALARFEGVANGASANGHGPESSG